MIRFLQTARAAFFDLLFPHTCAACGSSLLQTGKGICSSCLLQLPLTGFTNDSDNAVARVFWGRLSLHQATAFIFFQKKTSVQELMHQIKYRSREDAARQLGQWMGHQLLHKPWFMESDLLLPMPLHAKRLKSRGFNQAAVLCEGISSVTGIPMRNDLLQRQSSTSSQTTQHRQERWQNMQGVFALRDPLSLENKKLVLVDDVVTTGATLEALGRAVAAVPGTRISIACLAYTLPY